MSGDQSRIGRRLAALRSAITERDWENVEFHFNNVTRGIARLVADVETRLPVEEAWEPLERATKVPLSPEAQAELRARGADDALLEELREGEMWKNSLYTVQVTCWEDGPVQELSIRRNDREPVHDWRHFQMIKSQIAGPEIEAVEIYPAESRLMDTANQYYVFCLRPGMSMPMGYVGPRLLVDAEEQGQAGSVQRPLPPGWDSTFAALMRSRDAAQPDRSNA